MTYNKQWHKEYRKRNREKRKEWEKEYRMKNLERLREIDRKRAWENREKKKEYIKQWKKKNPEKVKEYKKRIRMKHKDKENSRSISLRKVELKSFCGICDSKSNLERHHWDYSDPLLVSTLCKPCHTIQHTKYFKEKI